MRTRAAVLHGNHQEWSVEEIELDPPKAGEVLVETAAAGLCHSDEHLVTGDLAPAQEVLEQMGMPDPFPIIGGHEGSGVVAEVGEGVTSVAPGDHVSASFIPSCGRCRWCASGMQNLCDLGAGAVVPGMITDGTFRHHTLDGQDLGTFAKLGTFAEHMLVSEDSLVKVDPNHDLTAVALVSCGVATGWGSSVHRAGVGAGETVVVVGVGGIGSNAVQGAKMAGAATIVAVDPLDFKREKAQEFGATHTAASMDEALPVVTDLTMGQMADRLVLCPGVVRGEMIASAMALVRKGGTVVVTGISPMVDTDVSMSLFELAMYNKELKGSIFGSGNPRADIPYLLKLYEQGQLKLDELVTRTYPLDDVNQGYQDMRDGKNIRGVLTF